MPPNLLFHLNQNFTWLSEGCTKLSNVVQLVEVEVMHTSCFPTLCSDQRLWRVKALWHQPLVLAQHSQNLNFSIVDTAMLHFWSQKLYPGTRWGHQPDMLASFYHEVQKCNADKHVCLLDLWNKLLRNLTPEAQTSSILWTTKQVILLVRQTTENVLRSINSMNVMEMVKLSYSNELNWSGATILLPHRINFKNTNGCWCWPSGS